MLLTSRTAFVALMVLVCAAVRADTVVLVNGEKLDGRVESQDATAIRLRTAQGVVRLARARVAEVKLSAGDAQGAVPGLIAGSLPLALTQISACAASTSDSIRLKSVCDALISNQWESWCEYLRKGEGADLAAVHHTVQSVEPSAVPKSLRVLELLAYAVERRWSDVRRGLDQVELPAKVRETLIGLAVARAGDALQQNELDAAIDAFLVLDELDPERLSKELRSLLVVRRAKINAAEGRIVEGLQQLCREVLPTAPAAAWKSANDLVRECATSDALQLELLEAWPMLECFADRAPYNEYCKLLLVVGEAVAESSDATTHVTEIVRRVRDFDADGAAHLEQRSEFYRRLSRVRANDYVAAYRLAAWGAERRLDEEAMPLFRLCLTAPETRDNARLQLAAIVRRQELETLKRLRQQYDEKRFDLVQAEVAEFLRTHPGSAYRLQVQRFAEMARIADMRLEKGQTARASAQLQEADRLLAQGSYDAAARLADSVRVDNQGTAIAAQASETSRKANAALGRKPDANSNMSSEQRRSAELTEMARKFAMQNNFPGTKKP